MRLIDPKLVNQFLNKCYLDYDPGWPSSGEDRMIGFKYYVERTAGLRLDLMPKQDIYGRHGYEVVQIAVTDERKYTMFTLRWS